MGIRRVHDNSCAVTPRKLTDYTSNLTLSKKENLGLLALHCFGIAVPTEHFTVFYCRFSAFFWTYKVMGFPPTSLRFISSMFPYNLLEARKTSMTMIISFTLASGICSCKRLLYNFLGKLTHCNSSTTISQ